MFLFILGSCKKYLDINSESTQSFVETAEDCQLILDKYGSNDGQDPGGMNVGYPSDGEASADDYFLTDQAYLNSKLSEEDRHIYIWSPNLGRGTSSPQWVSSYRVVFNSNLVLETLDKIKGSTDPVSFNALRGAALFFRSYAFWQVAQLYCKPYLAGTAGQDPGIPLRRTSDIVEKSSRGTVQQTYDRIIQDLNEAVNLLPNSSKIQTRPNKAAAYGMLARVYLSMEDYANALTAASKSLEIYHELLDYNNGYYFPFENRFKSEELFHAIMARTAMLNPGYDGSSAIARIDSSLVDSYENNDLRKSMFFEENGDGTYRFIGNYEPAFNSSDLFIGIAVDELYLTRAECYARVGNTSAAIADLNTLLVKRYATGSYVAFDSSNAEDVLKKVLSERRKELLMRGLRWTDLRRLNRDPRFQKTLTRKLDNQTYELPPNDLRYTLLLPREVIENTDMAQNPR